ncbi:MAG: hypothetical protein MI746_09260 [Pseudomonadales bacterium]|nr:hypothetical protein [Pseudomonadales bacterium]
MKTKDYVFYAISIFSLTLFMAVPFAVGYTPGTDMPGVGFCQELLASVEQFVAVR